MRKNFTRRTFIKMFGGVAAASLLPTRLPAGAALAFDSITYPRPLHPGDTIGITAPSAGVGKTVEPRLRFSIDSLLRMGYRVRMGKCLQSDAMASAPAAARAAELQAMLLDDAVHAVLPPWGGELLVDILPRLDWGALGQAQRKWIIGYSDVSTFMLPYTLRLHTATLNGSNLLETPIMPTDPALAHWTAVAALPAGEGFAQRAATRYQADDVDWERYPESTSFRATEPVVWKWLGCENRPNYHLSVAGRLLGGTLDVIGMLVGSEFGDVHAFAELCAPEGLLVYLDNCDMNTVQYCRLLHHLKLGGWFRRANAVLIGRTAGEQLREFTVRDALVDALGDIGIPVLYDLDIGHLPPQMILVNGALATVRFSPTENSVSQVLA